VALVYSTLADSTTAGALVTIDWATALQIALGNPSAVQDAINPAIASAEAGLPEGTRVQLYLTGWDVPIIGNVGARVADQINAQWSAGNIRDPNTGEVPQPWPEFPGAIAFYDPASDTVGLHWRKGQIFGLNLVVQIILILVATFALTYVVEHVLGFVHNWSMTSAVPASSGTAQGGGQSWWATRPLWEKFAIVGGGVVLVGFGLWWAAERSIAEAGATKSYQEIVIER
jgi:hypothetical protein